MLLPRTSSKDACVTNHCREIFVIEIVLEFQLGQNSISWQIYYVRWVNSQYCTISIDNRNDTIWTIRLP